MKTSNWSIAGYLWGIAFTIISFIRYYLLIPIDHDRTIAYAIIGFLVCAVSWLYNKQLQHSNTILAMEDYLADETS